MKIGIDVGGSHIGLGLVNEKGEIIYKKEKDYLFYEEDMSEVVIGTIILLIKEAIEKNKLKVQGIERVGIAIPGTVSNGSIIKAKNLGIQNLEIQRELKKVFNIPIILKNDAKCAAIAEKEYGSLKEYDDAMFLIIGTGIGGAVFLNGKLLEPKKYSGFEVGHMVIEREGKKCNCGRKGCFETYGSMKRFKERIQKEFKLESSEGKLIKQFIIENLDNKKLNEIIDKYIDDLAIGIINLVNIFEPQAISLGGSFAHYKDILLEKLEKRIIEKEELFNVEIPKLLVAKLKNDAGIIGAAIGH